MVSVQPNSLEDTFKNPELFRGKAIITSVSGLRPDFEGNTIGIQTDLKISIAETIANFIPDAILKEAFNPTFSQIIEQPIIEGHEKPTIFVFW